MEKFFLSHGISKEHLPDLTELIMAPFLQWIESIDKKFTIWVERAIILDAWETEKEFYSTSIHDLFSMLETVIPVLNQIATKETSQTMCTKASKVVMETIKKYCEKITISLPEKKEQIKTNIQPQEKKKKKKLG
eukprot:Anaeramoba_ignava/a90656_19.p1 GENE.a90656_19~~a90656_19.p1  ORF type:complete len:134 (+),score=48.06 a90656_19:253-654(+)